MFFRKTAQNQHRQVGGARADSGQRIDAALARHRNVEQNHIDLALAHDLERLAAVGRLGDDDEIDLISKELAQAGANHRMVVDNGNSNHGVG